jgi:hypothetical protein
MFRAVFEGFAAMIGWRVGEVVLDGAKREIRRGARQRRSSAREAYETQLAAAARELPGGTPASAVIVASSAQIEPHVSRYTCLACDSAMAVEQHRATTEDGLAVRALDLVCRECGGPRTAYYRIEKPS